VSSGKVAESGWRGRCFVARRAWTVKEEIAIGVEVWEEKRDEEEEGA